jgi:resuscitation-promoting factor RpfA
VRGALAVADRPARTPLGGALADGDARAEPARFRPSSGSRNRPNGRGARRIVRISVVVAAVIGAPVVALGAAGADPSAQDWKTLRSCESSGHYDIVADNGHYGAYQFDLSTWRSVGGSGLPSDASQAEQDYRALYLYRMRGWQPWECAGMRDLQPDADASSGQVPDRSDSRYMAPHGSGSGSGVPAWPGRVYQPGDCAAELKAWQLQMNAYGYDFVGTGCYGDKTSQAVQDLQAANGLPTSGLLGSKTWQAAWTGTAPKGS